MLRAAILSAASAVLLGISSCFHRPDLGTLVTRTYDDTLEVQGLSVSGDVTYYENGALYTAFLARQDTMYGHVFPAGSRITLRQDSTLDWTFLAHDAPLEGILCRGHGHDYMNAFHPNGRLRTAWLAGDQVIQGVPCMGATFWRDVFGGGVGVHFATNGQLIKAKLAEDAVIQGVAFEKGDHVRFDSLGVLLPKE